jgi:F-type H+-transporting ATPase subunit delta
LAEELQAKRFAQAVFEIAQERNEIELWSRDLAKMAGLAAQSDLVAVLGNPKFPIENKRKLLDVHLKGVSPLAQNMAFLLVGRGNFHLVTRISLLYQRLVDDLRSTDRAEITTAIPLEKGEKQKLADRLGALTGKRIIIIEKVDPGIIGGMIVRVAGKIIDGSTRTQLRALKNNLAGVL